MAGDESMRESAGAGLRRVHPPLQGGGSGTTVDRGASTLQTLCQGIVERAVQPVQIVAEAAPAAPGHAGVEACQRHAFDPRQHALQVRCVRVIAGQGRNGETAVAADDRGHAVKGGGTQQRVPEGLRIVVGVDIDETGRDDQSRGVQRARGGLGRVQAAHDLATGHAVALKRLHPRYASDPAVTRLLEREYQTLRGLSHPSVIEVYDYGVDAAGPYYTMELLDGSDLTAVAPLAWRRACAHLRDVASSLALLHARRLLHRDVTPRNVRVTAQGRAKLIDFGALCSFGRAPNVLGTAPCVPPEALSLAGLDQRSDLFALGAVAYFVLTGRHAYPATQFSDLQRAWSEPVAPPEPRPTHHGTPPSSTIWSASACISSQVLGIS